MIRDSFPYIIDNIMDTTKPQGLTAEQAQAAMAQHIYCGPERALISERQCQHLQARENNSCKRCPYRRGLEPMKGAPDVVSALFDLEGMVAGTRPEVPGDYNRLCGTLEDARDAVRDYLDGLDEETRAGVEFHLGPEVGRLSRKVDAMTQKAQEHRTIGKHLMADIAMLELSLVFVSGQARMTRALADFHVEDYL